MGTILISQACHRLADIEDISPYVRSYSMLPGDELEAMYGPALYPSILEENKKDCMDGVTPEMLINAWPEIRRIINTIPRPEELTALYEEIGAKKSMEDIEVPSAYLPQLLRFSPSARNRLTMMRVCWMLTV